MTRKRNKDEKEPLMFFYIENTNLPSHVLCIVDKPNETMVVLNAKTMDVVQEVRGMYALKEKK
jgi:hypothetical protein